MGNLSVISTNKSPTSYKDVFSLVTCCSLSLEEKHIDNLAL